MLAEKLKEHTSAVHLQLEQRLLAHIQSVDSPQQYASLLAMMYGYYAAIEKKLDEFHHVLPEYHIRRKSQSILNDLEGFNFPKATLSLCDDIPSIHSVPAALGVMYVLEGSTLGGKIISRMLKKRLPSLEGSTNFFDGYREETGVMWQRFREHLAHAVEESKQTETQKAAHETFLKFNNWIAKHEPAKLRF